MPKIFVCPKCKAIGEFEIEIADDAEAKFQHLEAVVQRSGRIVETALFSLPVKATVKPGCRCFKRAGFDVIEIPMDFFRRKK